jgi:flagellar capping protein FliD
MSDANFNTAGEMVSGKETDSQRDIEDSEKILEHMQEKYQQKQEELKKLKGEENKLRAAEVFTKRRYREVTSDIKKGGDMLSHAVLAARNESVQLLDRAKAKTRIHAIAREIDKSALHLGRDIYDLVEMGVYNVFDNENVKKILNRLNEYHIEIEMIHKKFNRKKTGESC